PPATAGFLIASRLQPGRVGIALARAQGLADDQATILRIPLRIARTAPVGTFDLTLNEVQLYDAQPAAMAGKTLNGLINVVSPPTDLDNDGLPDYWERQYFGDTSGLPINDSDRDGVSDYQEFVAGTDPTSA